MEPLSVRKLGAASDDRARGQVGALLALLIAAVALCGALILGPFVYRMWEQSYGPQMPPLALSRAIEYPCVYLPLYACLVFVRLTGRRTAQDAAFPHWRALAFGAAVGGGLFSLSLFAAAVLGAVQEHPAAARDDLLLNVGLMAALTAFQVYGEEGFFRGWLQPVFARDWGPFPALLVTAMLFAAAHSFAESFSLLAIANIFLAGLIFGALAFRTGGVLAPFTAHWVWNWVEQSVAGLIPNPGIDAMGSFFDLDLVGPIPLSGGTNGLNGSLVLTAVFAAALGAFLVTSVVKNTARVRSRP